MIDFAPEIWRGVAALMIDFAPEIWRGVAALMIDFAPELFWPLRALLGFWIVGCINAMNMIPIFFISCLFVPERKKLRSNCKKYGSAGLLKS